MGAQQGGLLATHIFLETVQEREKISRKSPFIAFVSNGPRTHRQGLGKEVVPWNVVWIQISLSLSLSLSLSFSLSLSLGFFLPSHSLKSPHPRLSVLVQVGVSQPGEQSNSSTTIFHQSSKRLSKMKAFFLK